MNIGEIWMSLESLSHLRQLPQYKVLQAKIENDLTAFQKSLTTPTAISRPEPEGEAPVIERRA